MNNVGIIGRMTKEPTLRTVAEGRVKATFILAVPRTYKSQSGEDADFVLCTVWGKIAENTVKYCGKGSLVGVTGRIHSSSYDKEDGSRVYMTEVIGEEVQFLSLKRKEDKQDFPEQVDLSAFQPVY